MVCFRLSKKNFLKLTFSLLTAFIILLGGIGHADADEIPNTLYASSASSSASFLIGTYERGSDYSGNPAWYNIATTTSQNAWINSYNGQYYRILWGESPYLFVRKGDNIYTGIYNDTDNYIGGAHITVSATSTLGCMDNMAVNYDSNANVDSGGCYYVLPAETATSTRIISFTFSTTTNTIDLSYYVATSSPVDLYVENRNERDGVINSAFSTTTTGLVELNNIPVTLPNPLNGAGYTYLTTKLVLASDHSIIYDWHTLTVDLYNGVDLGGGGYQQEECGITHLGGCFMNGLAVMFYPSQNAFNQFNNFVELIKTKPPVGYFYVVKNNLDNLSSTSTSAFTVTIPSHIKEYLFTPFDVGIGGILWFFFAINFYKRLKHITV
jgi:hypothetical protein